MQPTNEQALIGYRSYIVAELNRIKLTGKNDDPEYYQLQNELTKVSLQLADYDSKRFNSGVIGRPAIGKGKAVKITLPDEDWQHIDDLIAQGRVKSYADYFRSLHDSSLRDALIF